jgi:hypothetical protein
LDGIRFRRKLRLRRYETGEILTEETPVFLEIKQRVDRVTQKRRAVLPYREALRLCNWIDMAIGVVGLLSAISGLAFLLAGDPTTGILGISYQAINAVHTWSSLAAIVGVGAHMALHWKWMVSMTKQIFFPAEQRRASQHVPEMADGDAAGNGLSRRAFLIFGGAATAVAAAVVAGYQVLHASTAEASQSSNQLAAVQQESGVACPFGLVNDPYPGRCRHYRDSNGDGYCDYSVAGSGSNLSASGDESIGEGFSRRRSGVRQP